MTSKVSSRASASSLTIGIDAERQRPDEPGQPDQRHQPARPVRRLVVPDREAAVQVRQADGEIEQRVARWPAAGVRDRFADDGNDRPQHSDGQTDLAAPHRQTVTRWRKPGKEG